QNARPLGEALPDALLLGKRIRLRRDHFVRHQLLRFGSRGGGESCRNPRGAWRCALLVDCSAGALHALAWWLASTNRWRTVAPMLRPTRPCLASAVASEDEEERTHQSARLRLLGQPEF